MIPLFHFLEQAPKKGIAAPCKWGFDLPPVQESVEKNEVAAFEGIGGGGFGGDAARAGGRIPEAAAEEAGQEAGRRRGGERGFGRQCNRRWRRGR